MFKRIIYWITHNHHCNACCLFCKFFTECKSGNDNKDNDNADEKV